MGIQDLTKLGAGAISIANIRSDASGAALPTTPHFFVRAEQVGPFSLTTLALDFDLLLSTPGHAVNGWIVAPINRTLNVGQRLGWTVFTGFRVPFVAGLVINQKIRFLGRKDDLAAGGIWATGVTLQSHHLAVGSAK